MYQWFIVDDKTKEVLEGTNRNTLDECIYWYVEPEILVSSNPGDYYIADLWCQIAQRDRVHAARFEVKRLI